MNSANDGRLAAPAGRLINRERPLRFRFEGRSYGGFAGDSIASALAANGVWLLSRSFKYHRPRGPRSFAGMEADTLVQVGGSPNVFADLCPLEENMEITAQNYSGSLQRDRGAWISLFSRFLPVGFYYKAFFRPKGIWERLWEPLVRAGAGLGKVDFATRPVYCDKAYGFCDLAVIGGGPAGLSAARVAADAGAEVLLIEEQPQLGGSLNYARAADVAQGGEERERLVRACESSPGIEIMTGALCNGWFSDNWLPVIRGDRMHKIRAREVVFATGTMEQHIVFRNNDLPGILLASAVQRLIRLYGVRPGTRAVVLAGASETYAAALDLLDIGVDVAAIVDMRAAPPACAGSDEARRRGIRIMTGATVYEARAKARHVHSVRIARIAEDGRRVTPGEEIACDLVCVSGGYMPAYQLPLQAGGRLSYDDAKAAFSITGLPENTHLAGAANACADTSAADGRRAGREAASGLGLHSEHPAEKPAPPGDAAAYDWPIFTHPRHKEFVDFDEDLQVCDIVNACADGYEELELVKRYSTVGMGPSQGRHAALATARLVADATERPVSEIGVTTARPPLRPERLEVLAGRSFNPERVTPMHHRHLEAGAQMVPAGAWWRPACYGESRAECARSESLVIRQNVGVIDVSTLGKIELRGAGAARLLDRLYTLPHLKQAVGMTRYLMMLNEAGTIMDDGVACRLGDEHFYITTTTGNSDGIFRTLLWWNAQWQLEVDIANVTGAYAGVNIAGPRSRAVLKTVCEDVDLTPDGFPYLAVRTGKVAGIPARLFRVGFVGELGYEVHVPSAQGEALWDALLEAGCDDGVRPVGVEAQRLLRLEKGHVIIGQDTDSTTSIGELQMSWAIGRKKPFFVGKRSAELREELPLTRKLVAFHAPGGEHRLQESNLVLDGDAVAGHVTSVAYSPTLERTIGLAYARPDAEIGNSLRIKLKSGEVVDAAVVKTPFYDPDNERQKM